MTFLSQQSELQASFYAQLAHDLSKTDSIVPGTEIALPHIKTAEESSTQILNELGTTDTPTEDVSTEIMITTLGKIPNEMYYLEDSTPSGKPTTYEPKLHTTLESSHTTLVSIQADKSDMYSDRSTLLLISLITLLIILLLCCATACVIARSKSKHALFTRSDIECSSDCTGVNQPLLSVEKASDTSSKTSVAKN